VDLKVITNRRREGQEGVAAIEFAILLPLLVVLVFGIIEFSILLYDKAVITNASREGARAGIVFHPSGVSDGEIVFVVNNYCGAHLISFDPSSVITTTIFRTDEAFGRALTVTVAYQYHFLVLPNFIATLVGGVNLVAETVMRMEDQEGG